MKIIGREPIHPVLFYSGKGSGYITWVLFLLSSLGVIDIGRNPIKELIWLSYLGLLLGLCLSMISIVNLGSSTRLGLPTDKTQLKTHGLYRWSRNPMYFAFNLITISSTVYHANILVAAMGIFSILIYHIIIQAEERYMNDEFGLPYQDYKSRVRRYI